MHPNIAHLLSLMAYEHLPQHLQAFSRPFHDLAHQLVEDLTIATPPGSDPVLAYGIGSELGAALRKLRESKDCAVTAALCRAKLAAAG